MKRKLLVSFVLSLILAVAVFLPANTPSASACDSYPIITDNFLEDFSNPPAVVNYVSNNSYNRTAHMIAHNGTCSTLDVKVQTWSDYTNIYFNQVVGYVVSGSATVNSCSYVFGGKAWCYFTMQPGSSVEIFADFQTGTSSFSCYNGCKQLYGETWWTGHGVLWFTNNQYISVHP